MSGPPEGQLKLHHNMAEEFPETVHKHSSCLCLYNICQCSNGRSKSHHQFQCPCQRRLHKGLGMGRWDLLRDVNVIISHGGALSCWRLSLKWKQYSGCWDEV